jgi:glycerol-3-phosphate acyltransferase PlsY
MPLESRGQGKGVAVAVGVLVGVWVGVAVWVLVGVDVWAPTGMPSTTESSSATTAPTAMVRCNRAKWNEHHLAGATCILENTLLSSTIEAR